MSALVLLGGCVTGQELPGTIAAAAPDSGCTRLTEDRRKLAVKIDELESGRAAPGTFTSALMTIGMLNARAYQMDAMRGRMEKDRTELLADMRAQQNTLNQQIDDSRCTAASRASAGTIKATESAQYDGSYSGKGSTESWCTQPVMTLKLQSERVNGMLRTPSETYQVEGKLYDGGELSLSFKRPGSQQFTDDFDGSLKDGVLSLTANLDRSPQACVYRFAIRQGDVVEPDTKPAAPARLPTGSKTNRRT